MRRWWLIVLVVLTAAALVWLVQLRLATAPSELDTRFDAITVGMLRPEVERLLGPPADPDDPTVGRVVGFRAVDLPSLDRVPRPLPERVWWHDGQRRCLYVEFSDGRVWRAALFGPGWQRYVGG